LPWEETGAGGIVLDEMHPEVAGTPAPKSADAVVQTEAHLKLTEGGDLSGNIKLTYSGQEALTLKLEAIRQDEVARRKTLEESVSEKLAQGATVKLIRSEGWEKSEGPLTAEFEVTLPQFAMPAGSRLILPLNVFHAREKNAFASVERKQPIYFGHAYERYEDTTIQLADGLEVESLPDSRKSDQGAVFYQLVAKKEGRSIRVNRTYRIGGHSFLVQQYPALREFFNRVMAGDTQQVALRSAKTAGDNRQP